MFDINEILSDYDVIHYVSIHQPTGVVEKYFIKHLNVLTTKSYNCYINIVFIIVV